MERISETLTGDWKRDSTYVEDCWSLRINNLLITASREQNDNWYAWYYIYSIKLRDRDREVILRCSGRRPGRVAQTFTRRLRELVVSSASILGLSIVGDRPKFASEPMRHLEL